jgi:site-specific DNA-methyltransferase (adenine-specific)
MTNVVHLQDCMELMASKPDKYYDLAVVDPPYGIGADSAKISHKRTKPSRPNSYTQYPKFRYHKTDWDKNRPKQIYFNELFRVSKMQIIWGANYLCEFLQSGKGWIFWNKLNGVGNDFSDGEFAYCSKGVQSRYFECSQFDGLNGGKARIHPTQKPIALYDWIFANYAKPGMKILDTHVGSGSSRIAADKAGLWFEGTELDVDYWQAQEKRYKEYLMNTKPADIEPMTATGQLKIF